MMDILQLYRRSTEATHFGKTFSSIPLKILKSEVCQAVETEVHRTFVALGLFAIILFKGCYSCHIFLDNLMIRSIFGSIKAFLDQLLSRQPL